MTQDALFGPDGQPTPRAYPIDPSAECSADALASIDSTGIRALVSKEYASWPQGATAREITISLIAQGHRVTEFSIRPRVTELKQARLLFPTGERRAGMGVLVHRMHWRGIL